MYTHEFELGTDEWEAPLHKIGETDTSGDGITPEDLLTTDTYGTWTKQATTNYLVTENEIEDFSLTLFIGGRPVVINPRPR
jgi:hypothetical protein